jgi:O-antigen/teichoic acid export membrane protein
MNKVNSTQTSQIGRGTLFILVSRISVIVLAAGQATIIPRVLGPESMGFYSYWLSVFLILGDIFGLGGSYILARYIPELRAKNEAATLPMIKRVIGMKLPIICLGLLVGLFLFPHEKSYYLVVLLSAALYSLGIIIQGTFYGYKQMGKYASFPLIRQSIKFLLILFMFLWLGDWGVLLAILWGCILTDLILTPFLIQLLPKSSGALAKPFRDYLIFGLWLYVGAIFMSLPRWLIVILAKRYITDMATIGFLGLALHVSIFTSRLFLSVGESALPSWVEFHVTEDKRLTKSTELGWKYTNMILSPIVFGILVLIDPVIRIIIGKEFLPSTILVNLFLPAIVFSSWAHIHRQILVTFEKKKLLFMGSFISFVVFLVSSFYLIRIKGILGAPIAVSLGALAGYMYVYRMSMRIKKIPRYFLHIIRPLLASVVMAFILKFIHVDNLIYLLGSILLGAIVYFLFLWAIKGIDKTDIHRIKNIFISQRAI